MHNRCRMIVASFLCKTLLVDWRKGEAYFAKKLLDFDFAANNGGWAWASSSGCDAQPYRIFNPTSQSPKSLMLPVHIFVNIAQNWRICRIKIFISHHQHRVILLKLSIIKKIVKRHWICILSLNLNFLIR